MDVRVKVVNQELKIAYNVSSRLAPDSQEFVRFIFELPSDWDGLTTFAQFIQGSNAYNQYLDENNSAYLPTEIEVGECFLLLYGTGETIRATTNCVELTINDNMYVANAQSTVITQSLYEQLVDLVRASMRMPVEAHTAAEMVNTTEIYVYTGSEQGYTTGHWYYWNGNAWQDNGQYYSGIIDSSLSSSSTNAVQNRVVKNALDGKQDDFSYLIIPENNGKVLKVVDGQLAVGEGGGGGGSTLIAKTITSNGVYFASDDNVDGYSKVTVNVEDKTVLAVWAGMISDVDCGSAPNIISYAAYMNPGISKVYGSNVVSIGSYAFYGCGMLFDASFPNAQIINASAFASCSFLQTASFPLCEFVGSNAFSNCLNLESATFENIRSVYTSAFYNCRRLNTLPLSYCTRVESYAFGFCYMIDSVSLPLLSDGIGVGAFNMCSNLSTAYLPLCTAIGSNAFASCANLESVYMPNVISIYSGAFQLCSRLSSVSIPNCRYIGGGVTDNTAPFRGCSLLTSWDLPECVTLAGTAFDYSPASTYSIPKVTTMGSWAFRMNTNLLSIDAPNLTTMGSRAFGSCHVLSRVSMPKLQALPSNAFDHCFLLEYIDLPEASTMTYGTEGTFGFCSTLSWASLPKISGITSSCFKECISLESLYLLGSRVATLSNTNAFTNTPMSSSALLGHFGSIYVPSSLYSSYIRATNWSAYSARFVSV